MGKGIEHCRLLMTWIFVLALVFVLVFSESKLKASCPLAPALIFMMGCFLVGIASLGRLWCTLYISGYKNQTLVTTGPYSICRNPLYFFSFLGGIGLGCATETLTIPAMVIVVFGLYYPFVIKSEEKTLQELHGEAFTAYLHSTPAFFPRYSRLQEPPHYVVEPRIFRKRMFDTLWFIWLIGIVELLEAFHDLNVFPVWFRLY